MGRIRQGLAPARASAPHGRDSPPRAGVAVAVALQDFVPDGFLNLLDGLASDVFGLHRERLVFSVAARFFSWLFMWAIMPSAVSNGPWKGDRKSTRLNSSHLGISYA